MKKKEKRYVLINLAKGDCKSKLTKTELNYSLGDLDDYLDQIIVIELETGNRYEVVSDIIFNLVKVNDD